MRRRWVKKRRIKREIEKKGEGKEGKGGKGGKDFREKSKKRRHTGKIEREMARRYRWKQEKDVEERNKKKKRYVRDMWVCAFVSVHVVRKAGILSGPVTCYRYSCRALWKKRQDHQHKAKLLSANSRKRLDNRKLIGSASVLLPTYIWGRIPSCRGDKTFDLWAIMGSQICQRALKIYMRAV